MAIQKPESLLGSKLTYPEPPQDLKDGKFMELLKYFGPGAILASITVGSGEVFFAARGGAVFGYVMLWTFIWSAIFKGVMTYSANRYMTITGEHPMTRWAYIFPGPKGWFPVLLGILSILCFPSWSGGLAGLLGLLYTKITGVGAQEIWGTGFMIAAFILFMTGGYTRVEKSQVVVINTMVIAMLVALVVSKPDWVAVITGSIIPSMPDYAPWVAEKYPAIAARPVWIEVVTYLGAIGGGTYDYIGYTGMLREKKWGMLGRDDYEEVREYLLTLKEGEMIPLSEEPEEIEKGLTWAKAPMMDNFISYGLLVIFTIAFMVNGANILHSQQVIPDNLQSFSLQAQFMTQIHPIMVYVYYLAVTLALFGTSYSILVGYAYTFYETFSPVSEKIRKMDSEKIKTYIAIYTSIGGLLLLWTKLNPVIIITPASIVGGVLTGGIWCLAMIYTEHKMLPKAYHMKSWVKGLLWISGIALTSFGLIAIAQALGLF